MISNRKIQQTIKERCIELDESDEYQEARDEEFNNQLRDFLEIEPSEGFGPMTEEDVQGFLDSFTFQDKYQWIYDKAESEAGDYADQAYEDYKDRRMFDE